MKDASVLKKTLEESGIAFSQSGAIFNLSSGDFKGASVNVSTGTITSGDVDYFKVDASKLGLLRQKYAETLYKEEAFKEGILVESRTVEKDGSITLMCRMA